jgi:Fe-S-cluster-containing hydrogenase component 2
MFIRGGTLMKYIRGIIYIASIAIICAFFQACDPGPTAGAFLSVDDTECVGCRECVKVCNADAIIMISNKAVIDLTKCIECLKCIEACPYDAIE